MLTTYATYIATALELTLGKDIFLHNLPLGVDEGLVVQSLENSTPFSGYETILTTVFIFNRSWLTTSSLKDKLTNALLLKYGSIKGSWTIIGDITKTDYGLDAHERFISAVNATIKYI